MESITRKKLLYKSGLGFLCVNAALGCSHGCRYPCYAFMMGKSYGSTASYEEWCRPKLVSNAAELLERELDRLKERPDCIHFSLTTDPFMAGYPEVEAMSLDLIELYNALATGFPERDCFYRRQKEILARFCGKRGIECHIGG